MNNFAKRAGIIGATGAAAAGLIIAGAVMPANAETTSAQAQGTKTSVSGQPSTDLNVGDLLHQVKTQSAFGNLGLGNVGAGNGGLVNGPLVGPVASGDSAGNGNAIASGNSGNSVASGNNTANGTSAGNGTTAANGTSVPVGSGNSVSAPAASGNTTDTGLSNLGSNISSSVNSTVGNALSGLTGSLGTGSLLGR